MHASLGGEPVLTPLWVAQQKTIPAELAKVLRSHKDEYIRGAYASRKDTPSKILERYEFDYSLSVLACAAGNPNAPLSILKKALESKDWAPRQQACGNENLPDELLLAHYLHFGWVEYIVLVNKGWVPKQVLEHIKSIAPDWRGVGKEKRDWNEDLRSRARKRLGLVDEEVQADPGK